MLVKKTITIGSILFSLIQHALPQPLLQYPLIVSMSYFAFPPFSSTRTAAPRSHCRAEKAHLTTAQTGLV